jgi:putative aldouronate transport system substrate-binding protein
MQDAYLDYLTLLREWFELGLIDPDSPALSGAQVEANIVEGIYGITFGKFGGFGPHYRAQVSGAELNPDFILEPIPNLPLVRGDQVRLKNFNFFNKGEPAIISATSDHPHEAAAFLDFGFTEYGSMLFNYGVEGISWERGPDGEVVWTDRIINSPDGSWVNIRERYKRHVGPHHRFDLAAPMTDFELHLIRTWDQPSDDLAPVLLIHTQEEQSRFITIMGDVNTIIAETKWRFISGDEPLANFDAFRDRLVQAGIEEATAIQNAAYQRYLARTLN